MTNPQTPNVMKLPPNSELSVYENYVADLLERGEPFLVLRGDPKDTRDFVPHMLTMYPEYNLHGRHFKPVYHESDSILVMRPRKLEKGQTVEMATTSLRADIVAWKAQCRLDFAIHAYGQDVLWPARHRKDIAAANRTPQIAVIFSEQSPTKGRA